MPEIKMSDSSDSDFEDLAAAIKTVGSDKEDENTSEDENKSQDKSDEVEVKETPVQPKRRKVDPKEEKELNTFLFGDKEGFIKKLEGEKLFFTDVTGDDGSEKVKAPVWHDSDDEDFKKSNVHGEAQLKRKFERIAGAPSWAKLDKQEHEADSDDDDAITKTVGHLAKQSASKNLSKGELAFKRLANINKATMKEGRITSVEFHPKSTVGIVAGMKGMVSIFAIDGRENKK